MSGGKYTPIDCEKAGHDTPFKAETHTKNTVGNSDCKIDANDPPAEQVVEFTADNTNEGMVYAHANAASTNSDIEIVSDEWETNIELPSGTKESAGFSIKKVISTNATTDTLVLNIYYSDYKIHTDDPNADISAQADYWGNLDPDVELS